MSRISGSSGPGVLKVTGTTPIVSSGGFTPDISILQSSGTQSGYLSATDWNIFNNKLSGSRGNFILNPDAEVDTANWNLYDNSGRTTNAFIVINDITFTAVASGNAGNGINIDYIFSNTQPSSTPLVTVVSPTHITIAWYNGPTLANNPTATQLKAAFDAVPGAVALATASITGTASNLQYITGSHLTGNGGDTSPTTGTGGSATGVTFTRSTSTPLVGAASFHLIKDASNRQGEGVSTDFIIDALDKGNYLQISFAYLASSGMVLGSNSDVQVFIYDITNGNLIPVIPSPGISNPILTAKTYVGKFLSVATSVNYRLILHISTTNTSAWDLELDNFVVSGVLDPVVVTQVPSLVLQAQPISGAVTDHMCVMWRDSASMWVPATIAGACIPVYGIDTTQLGFTTNIVGSVADIYIQGAMDGFSFGPFVGYNQYIDTTAGSISPLPSPFTDLYCSVGKAISSTVLNIQFTPHVDLISNGSGVPIKGGLLTNKAADDGTGDSVLSPGTNGTVLVANSANANGLQYLPAVVASAPFTYTTATRTLTAATATNSVAGFLSAADHITYSGYAATIALKAPLASPVFTGDVNASTGNVLISTVGKGLRVKTGANSRIGQATLVAGTVVVTNTSVTANSRIFLTVSAAGGTQGFLKTTKSASTSFTITSTSATETSVVDWLIVESM